MTGYRVLGFEFLMGAAIIFAALFSYAISYGQTSKGYDVISYNATVKLDRQTDSIFGEVTMTARTGSAIATILQHAKYLTIDSVFVNGSHASFSWQDTAMGIFYDIPKLELPIGQIFTVKTYYHGIGLPEQNQSKWGGVTDDDSMMFAMGAGFKTPYTSCTRHWLPCYDLPDDKADSVDLTFICRDSDVTASNGLLISNTTANGWRTMHWHGSNPVATYLLTFATGPYTEQNIENSSGKQFIVYALKRDSAAAAFQMNGRVRQVLTFYDSLFAPYPFEKIGYVIAPFGSMEHQSMITLDKHVLSSDVSSVADTSDKYLIAAHELSHQWWGDWVTCKTFDDAWLNEGFATFCESLALEHFSGRDKYIARQHANIVGAKSSQLPLFGAATVDGHTNNYPGVIYRKGAVVLGMLRQYLGDSVFFDAVRYYGNTHAYNTATSYDLLHSFEHVSGQNLGWFFNQWVFGTGYPIDTIIWSRGNTGALITFKQVYNDSATPYFRVPVVVQGITKGGKSKIVTVWMDSNQSSTVFANFGFKPDNIVFDPDGLLLWDIVKSTETSDAAPDVIDSIGLMFGVFSNF